MNTQTIFYKLTGQGWRPNGEGFMGGGFAIEATKAPPAGDVTAIHITQENNPVDEALFVLPAYCRDLRDAGYNAQVCGLRLIVLDHPTQEAQRVGGYIAAR